LQEQDYPGLSVLVVDQASDPPLADRVAAIAPDFYLRRLETNTGFGPGANAVLGVVEGASHFLFCHDDVVLAPDATRQMVEEAFRQNAGIIAPKLVDPTNPDRILQLGLGVDRFGAPVPRVERLEFDQAQHDEVQEAFAAPGGCTLVRADLFEALGGFDEEISMFGEDVDFCWRARIAGARAFVVPFALVEHYEATASRLRPLPDSRALQWRHELRAVLKNYSTIRRAIVLVEMVLLSILEGLYFLARGRPDRSKQVVDAWRWNLKSARHLKAARAAVEASRTVSDFELRALFTHRTSRALRFLQPRLENVLSSWSASSKATANREIARLTSPRTRVERWGLIIAIVILLIGNRSLIFGHLPSMGGYLPLPTPTALLSRYFHGVAAVGVGHNVPASPALLLLGLSGIVAIGAMGVLLKVVLIGSIALGAFGVARLMRPYGGSFVRLVGVVVYLFVPLCWNDVATGDVLGLVAYGGAPYLLGRLLRATGVAPFATNAAPRTRAGLFRELLGFSLLLALVGSFVPAAAIYTPLAAVSLGIGCALLGEWRAGLRVVWVSLASLFGAAVLTFPWSLSFLTRGVSLGAILGPLPGSSFSPQLGEVLRLQIGPYGAGIVGIAFFVAALFVLVATGGDRFRVAVVVWMQLIGSALFVWSMSEGWVGHVGGDLRVLAAPMALAIAVEVALGAAVVQREIISSGFGWRHLVSALFIVASVAGLFPIIGASLNGRFGVPAAGDEEVLNWIQPPTAPLVQRALYLGDATALPGSSLPVSPGVAGVVSSSGLASFTSLFPGGNVAAFSGIVGAIDQAESGATIRLGQSLKAYGIRYVIVPTSAAPRLVGTTSTPEAIPPEILLDALNAQSDFHELPNEAGIVIFENTAWTGRTKPLTASGTSAIIRELGVIVELIMFAAIARFGVFERRRKKARERDERIAARSVNATMREMHARRVHAGVFE
jgi:GT2 family glycosyltransferase